MKTLRLLALGMTAGASALALMSWRGEAQQGAPLRQTSVALGTRLPGLTPEQSDSFDAGLLAFVGTETAEDGLGPVFNGTSCAECHKAGAIGGGSLDRGVSRVRRIGGIRNGVYSDLVEFGGPVLQARSLAEFDTAYPVPGERVPREANFVSWRITTPLFGAGLIEAIPDEAILSRAGKRDADGVAGVANRALNPETGKLQVGRFGWKAQHASLLAFAGDAYLNEMGITTKLFPEENRPQGRPIPRNADTVSDPEDNDGDMEKFTTFMRFLAAPGRRLPLTPQVQAGERVFAALRCASCHTPEMRTGANPVAALANQRVPLYSDLLLHRMGGGLADGIRQGTAQGDQFRTAPLWGLSRRNIYLHDGRANTLHEAIMLHEGEATAARNRFVSLNSLDREALFAFLNSL